MKKLCLSSMGKQFYTVETVNENETCSNVIVLKRRFFSIVLSDDVHWSLVGV